MTVQRIFPPAVRNILAAADTHRAKIDPTLRKRLDAALDLIDRAATIRFTAGPTLPDAVADALANDRDPVTDPVVQAAITRQALQTLHDRNEITESAHMRLFTPVVEHLGHIIAAFQPTYNTAAGELTKAHKEMTAAGVTSLTDPEIMSAGMDIARANITARDALTTMTAITYAINQLRYSTGMMSSGPLDRTMQTTDTGNATVTEIRDRGGRVIAPWDALTYGYAVSLATPEEMSARTARATANEHAAAAAFQLANRSTMKH